MFYRAILKPLFFRLSPEAAHHLVVFMLKFLMAIPGIRYIFSSVFTVKDKRLHRNVLDLDFPNPVGLAAGFDKDAKLVDELACIGFGFVEIGTVTPLPQPGNEKPRMFRLPEDEALINRMGFNNEGVKEAAKRLRNKKSHIIIGGNIGKNKITPNENAITDYEICFKELEEVVDYFVVNVSSPNTPGLRELQEKEPLKKILRSLQSLNNHHKPIFLKIAPDLNEAQLDDIIEIVVDTGTQGIVATNTTISRNGLRTPESKVQSLGAGGLSGKPLTARSTEVIRYLSVHNHGRYKIIGVGGIHTQEDAIEKIKAGADLVQIYTGFIYEGPALVRRINKALLKISPAPAA